MSDTADGDILTELEQTLAELTERRRSYVDREEPRARLAALDGKFNDTAHPALEKLVAAFPEITDYGTKWIVTRMLRGIGLQNGDEAGKAFASIEDFIGRETDLDLVCHAADHLRDIALAQGRLAVPAAAILLKTLEKETGSRNPAHIHDRTRPQQLDSLQSALCSIGGKYEAAAAVAVHGLAGILGKTDDAGRTGLLVRRLEALGHKWPSQRAAVFDSFSQKLASGVNNDNAILLVHALKRLALASPPHAPKAIEIIAEGFGASSHFETQMNCANALADLGRAHPAAAVACLERTLEAGLTPAQNRLAVGTLGAIAHESAENAKIISGVLVGFLPHEKDPFNRRLAAQYLVECARNGAASAPVVEVLNKEMDARKDDPDTRKELERALFLLGHVRPYNANVTPLRRP